MRSPQHHPIPPLLPGLVCRHRHQRRDLLNAVLIFFAAAALAADRLAELIDDEGDVAIVAPDQTRRTGVDRRDGFRERMKHAQPKVKVVGVQYGGGDDLKSTEVTQSLLRAIPSSRTSSAAMKARRWA